MGKFEKMVKFALQKKLVIFFILCLNFLIIFGILHSYIRSWNIIIVDGKRTTGAVPSGLQTVSGNCGKYH